MKKWTPWRSVQNAEELAPGIISYSTASHGGIWIDKKHQQKLEKYTINNWLDPSQWWEEDCDWAIPYVLFSTEIQTHGKPYKFTENLMAAYNIVISQHPEFYKQLPESYKQLNEHCWILVKISWWRL